MDALKVIGTNIAHLRNALGLSQQQLAEYLEVNRVEVSYFETGQRAVSNAKLTMLADLAGIETVDLRSETFSQKRLEVKFAFRSDGFDLTDLQTIAEFQRIARTYIRYKHLLNTEDL